MKRKIINALIKLSLILPSYAFAFGDSGPLVQTQGYWSPIYPGSPYWPYAKVSLPGYGTPEQQENIATNPDAFCASQGEGWRLPSLSDITFNGYQIAPGFATNNGSTSRFGSIFSDFWGTPPTPELFPYVYLKNRQFHSSEYIKSVMNGNNKEGIGLGWRENLHPSNFWDGNKMTKPKLDIANLTNGGSLVPSSLSVLGTIGETLMGLQIESKDSNGLNLGYGSLVDTTKELFYQNQSSAVPLSIFGLPPALFNSVITQKTPQIRYWVAETTSPEMLTSNLPTNLTAEPNRAIFTVEWDGGFGRVRLHTRSIAPTETANILCLRQYY